MSVAESHVQGIARFIVGYGTEEDENWRTYHFDFCGNISYYDDGKPKVIKPADNSGYSLGMLQLDFGQTTSAAKPFLDAFDNWHATTPGSPALISTRDHALTALTSIGPVLADDPSKALWRQDVEALSAFVITAAGSDWTNKNVDCALIGSDAHHTSPYGEPTLMASARRVESTRAFQLAQHAGNAHFIDLLYALSMKGYNQGPKRWRESLLVFLETGPSEDDVAAWTESDRSDKWLGGQAHTVANAKAWSSLTSSNGGTKPQAWLTGLKVVMDTQAMANPITTSKISAEYVALRQVFESASYFQAFAQAVAAGKDYIPSRLFDPKTGAIAINSTTKRIVPGVMTKGRVAYVWDIMGNAYQMINEAWSPVDIGRITSKRSWSEIIRATFNDLVS
ncbi:hypothetical protein [Bradyrhizobium sp. CCGUVB14]|uniref:hypothetical protein n=1 Tax=Bradyrhizobium sp. CCGUVB14 TaxID=2949628 RepID=UPI0020B31A5A|nr:hypothetical protein [Bradyrhizobium sp. CCGUVB14]MCP3442010.1 hypothetical protein [Bradyrhizobium sp. CCGUVB14]